MEIPALRQPWKFPGSRGRDRPAKPAFQILGLELRNGLAHVVRVGPLLVAGAGGLGRGEGGGVKREKRPWCGAWEGGNQGQGFAILQNL